MASIEINYLAILVSAVASMVLGGAWYSKLLFGKMWMRLVNRTQDEIKSSGGATKAYIIGFLVLLVVAYILAHFVSITATATAGDAIMLAFWIWLGFIGTITLNDVLYTKKPFKLWCLNNGYNFVSLAIMAVILALWQ